MDSRSRGRQEKERREKSDYLQYETEAGLFADFHANRHLFITNLARAGVLPKVAQTLARHSDIRLTMNVYSHTDRADEAAAVAKLPRLAPPSIKASTPTEVNPGRNEPENGRQYYGSTLVAGDATLGQSVAVNGTTPKKTRPKERRRKALPESDLATDVNDRKLLTEVHPPGFEPGTFVP